MRAGLGILVADLAESGVTGTINDPYRVGACGCGEGSHHLVGLLIDGNLEVLAADCGDARLFGSLKLVGAAGREGCSNTTAYQTCAE